MPRYPFTSVFNVPELPDLSWEPLESASELTFTEPQRAKLLAALNRYLEHLARQEATALMRDVIRQIRKFPKPAETLAELLRLHLSNAPSDERQMNRQTAVLGEIFPFDLVDPQTLARVLSQLALNARLALERLHEESERGRPRKDVLRVMIQAWHAIYIQAGGSGPGCTRSGGSSKAKGPLLDLIDGAFQQVRTSLQGSLPAEAMPPTRDALAQRILAALRQPHEATIRDEK
jgi:hypothetical protein